MNSSSHITPKWRLHSCPELPVSFSVHHFSILQPSSFFWLFSAQSVSFHDLGRIRIYYCAFTREIWRYFFATNNKSCFLSTEEIPITASVFSWGLLMALRQMLRSPWVTVCAVFSFLTSSLFKQVLNNHSPFESEHNFCFLYYLISWLRNVALYFTHMTGHTPHVNDSG